MLAFDFTQLDSELNICNQRACFPQDQLFRTTTKNNFGWVRIKSNCHCNVRV